MAKEPTKAQWKARALAAEAKIADLQANLDKICDDLEASEEMVESVELSFLNRFQEYLKRGGKNHNYLRWKIENS